MTNPIHVSMDTETWGKRAGYDGRSLGACIFDPNNPLDLVNNPEVFADLSSDRSPMFYVALSNRLMGSYSSIHYTQRDLDQLDYRSGAHRAYHLKRDPETVDWWYSRSPEAQAAFANPVDLKVGLQMFTTWLQSWDINPKDEDSSRVWSHGAAFDPPIVDAWFDAVDLPLPWHYRAPRDTRTCFDMAGINNHSQWLRQFQYGVFHHSRDDSITQARGITEAHRHRKVN